MNLTDQSEIKDIATSTTVQHFHEILNPCLQYKPWSLNTSDLQNKILPHVQIPKVDIL